LDITRLVLAPFFLISEIHYFLVCYCINPNHASSSEEFSYYGRFSVGLCNFKCTLLVSTLKNFRSCDTRIISYVEICGNKMPTRCNRGFYCRSYCLLNMFRAPLCPSSGAQEYYTVVAACGISCCGFQVAGLVRIWELFVRFAGCLLLLSKQ